MTIDPGTALEMDMRTAIASLHDVVNVLPAQVVIALPETGTDFFPIALHLGARMTQRGYTVSYRYLETLRRGERLGRGLILFGSEAELRAAGFMPVQEDTAGNNVSLWREGGQVRIGLTNPADRGAVDFLTSDLLPIARTAHIAPDTFVESRDRPGMTRLSDIGADTSVQRVSASRTWDIKYGLASLPGGQAPDGLHLEIRLPEGPGDFTNLVHTQFNGELIDSRHMQTGQLNAFTLNLPPQAQSLHNDIRVSLQRHRDEAGCAITAQRYPIQLLPGSALLHDAETPPLAGLAGLPYKFRYAVDLRVPRDLTPAERLDILQLGAETVASFVPGHAEVSLHYVDPEAPLTTRVERPFIAFNHVPSNAETPLVVDGRRVAMHNAAGIDSAMIGNVAGVALLQAADAWRASRRGWIPDASSRCPA